MNVFQALLLGILQGATEFIPISSSGHLVLVPWLFGWEDPGLAFDALIHWGTLLAILTYFPRDIRNIIVEMVQTTLEGRPFDGDQARLGWLIVLGTLPAAFVGFFFEEQFTRLYLSPMVAAVALFVTGGLLILSEKAHLHDRPLSTLSPLDAIVVGLAQALAIVPGISRSGATIAAGLWRNIDRAHAARFSFLLMAPVVFGAGLLQTRVVIERGLSNDTLLPVAVGFLAAAVTGYGCLGFLIRYLERASLHVFAYWCWGFGALNLIIVWIRG